MEARRSIATNYVRHGTNVEAEVGKTIPDDGADADACVARILTLNNKLVLVVNISLE